MKHYVTCGFLWLQGASSWRIRVIDEYFLVHFLSLMEAGDRLRARQFDKDVHHHAYLLPDSIFRTHTLLAGVAMFQGGN